jgi:high-affinity nickel permease
MQELLASGLNYCFSLLQVIATTICNLTLNIYAILIMIIIGQVVSYYKYKEKVDEVDRYDAERIINKKEHYRVKKEYKKIYNQMSDKEYRKALNNKRTFETHFEMVTGDKPYYIGYFLSGLGIAFCIFCSPYIFFGLLNIPFALLDLTLFPNMLDISKGLILF